MIEPLEALPIGELRLRSSTKWRTYPDDVLPMFVAEHDFPLAPAVSRVLMEAVVRGDVGYTPPRPGIAEAFSAFAERRFGWRVDPALMRPTGDVMMGVVEILRRVTEPGDRVVITPPVYQPFFDTVDEAGCVVEQVPLVDDGARFVLDLDGLERAFRGGARAMLLCNPHNPTGTVHSRTELAAVADLAAGHGVRVVSDEIHGPLTMPGEVFTPFLTVSDAAADVGFAVTSASKAFNLAGLKCAVMIGGSEGAAGILRGMHDEVEWRTGLLGAIATRASFSPESDVWLDGLLAALDRNRRLLTDLLAAELPGARYRLPAASYLAWVNLEAMGWGDNPAARIRREAKVAFQPGPVFGAPGAGHIRINIGCSPDVLTEAVRRTGALLPG